MAGTCSHRSPVSLPGQKEKAAMPLLSVVRFFSRLDDHTSPSNRYTGVLAMGVLL